MYPPSIKKGKIYCPDDMIAVPTKFRNTETVHKESKFGRFLLSEETRRIREKKMTAFQSYTKKMLLEDVLLNEDVDIHNVLAAIPNHADKGRFYEAMWDVVIMLGYLRGYDTNSIYDIYPYKMEKECFLLGDKIEVASYLENETIQSGNKRGISDITLREKIQGTELEQKWACERHFSQGLQESKERLVFFSSKFYETEKSVTKYDIQSIFTLAGIKKETCPIDSYKIVLLIHNKTAFLKKVQRSSKGYYLDSITDIFDLGDLSEIIHTMRVNKKDILDSLRKATERREKPSLSIRFHQLLVVHKTIPLLCKETIHGLEAKIEAKALWGQIARSGKTFTSGLLLSKLQKGRFFENLGNFKNIVLVITPAPTETSMQFTEELFKKYKEFQTFETYKYDQRFHKKYKDHKFVLEDTKKYIFVVSKQFLQGDTGEKEEEEEDMYANKETIRERCSLFMNRVALLFFDEIHYGGSTDIAKNIIDAIQPCTQVFLTATYKKPYDSYNFVKEELLTWSIEDIRHCKTIHTEASREQLYNTHGYASVTKTLEEMSLYYQCSMYELYTLIEQEYRKYPDIHILTSMFQEEKIKEIFKEGPDVHYGFDMNRVFELQDDKQSFQNEGSIKNLLTYVGTYIYPRIARIQQENLQMDRFTTQLWFLPYFKHNRIRNIAPTLERYIKSLEEYKDYEVISVLKKEDKEFLRKKELEAYFHGKKGLILLAGKKLSLGISLPCTDVVLFLNNDSEVDVIYQRMFRSLTEREGKKVGFIVDINPIRTITATIDYALSPQNRTSTLERQKEICKSMLENHVIYVDHDLFYINESKISIEELYKKVNKMLQDTEYIRLTREMDRTMDIYMDKVFDAFDMHDWKDIVAIRPKKKQKETLVTHDLDIPKPNPPTPAPGPKQDTPTRDVEKEREKEEQSLQEKKEAIKVAWKDIIVVMAFLDDTKHTDTNLSLVLEKLEKYIRDNPFSGIKDCPIEREEDADSLDIWKQLLCIKFSFILGRTNQSSTEFTNKISTMLTYIYKDLSRKTEVNKMFKNSKDILMNINTDSPEKLHAYVEKYLPPKEHEKKEYGEVFTPLSLVREMLDGITTYADSKFWSNPDLKILDPAAGIGNFPLIAYEKLMKGLERKIPKEEARRKHILENMLYMIELNPVNVRIMKRIFNDKKYNLNIIRGDALDEKTHKKLFEKAGTYKFDLVMGNPPYNKGGIKSHTGAQLGEENKTIWPEFVTFALSIIKPAGYVAYIHPLSWLKKTHSLHSIILEKYLVWLKLWDNIKTLKDLNGKIPVSIYILKNILNNSKYKTIIRSEILSQRLETTTEEYLDKDDSVPLAYHSIFHKLKKFINIHKCPLEFHTKTVKSKIEEAISLPKKYTLEDMWAIDTITVKDGIMVKKTETLHPDGNKQKLIIANKSGFYGAFIDNGRLGLTGNHKYYILGNHLGVILKILQFSISKIITNFTKYGQDFLDNIVFEYIPDLRKLGITDITEAEFYKLLKLTDKEIKQIQGISKVL